jgi:hypothetical protein
MSYAASQTLPAASSHTGQAVTQERIVPEAIPDDTSLAGVLELLLKNRLRLDTLLRDEQRQRELIPRMLTLALAGFATYGVVATLFLNALRHYGDFWPAGVPAAYWNDISAGNLVLAYGLGLIGANGICLPSFYFYGLLAGVKPTMLGVTAHALKGMAAGAVALVGIVPIYVALALSALVFPTPREVIAVWAMLGLALPFIAGTWGAMCLYQGFVHLCDNIPSSRRESRQCLLRRLILAWCTCQTLVTPLVIYTLWRHLGHGA